MISPCSAAVHTGASPSSFTFDWPSFVKFDCTEPSSCAIVQGPGFATEDFIDPTAFNIWNTIMAYVYAPGGISVSFTKTIYLDESHPCLQRFSRQAKIYLCVKDCVTAYINGEYITRTCGCESIAFPSWLAGNNTLSFEAVNYGGPASLLFAVYCWTASTSILLVHSDATWCTGSSSCSTKANVQTYSKGI